MHGSLGADVGSRKAALRERQHLADQGRPDQSANSPRFAIVRRGALVENIGKVLQNVVLRDERRHQEIMGWAALPVGTQEKACPTRFRALYSNPFPVDIESQIVHLALRPHLDPSFVDFGSWPNRVLGAPDQAHAHLRVLCRRRQPHFAEAHEINVPSRQQRSAFNKHRDTTNVGSKWYRRNSGLQGDHRTTDYTRHCSP